MYYYSNNYSKYIEKLKAEKSKVAFRQLVEKSQEQKSPDIIIENDVPSKDDNVSVVKDLEVPSKDGKRFSHESETISKDRNNISTEKNKTDSKSTVKVLKEDLESKKGFVDIINESEFDGSFSNNINVSSIFDGKEEEISKVKDINNSKEFSSKSANEVGTDYIVAKKAEFDISANGELVSKDDIPLNKIIEAERKSENGLDRNQDLLSKDSNEIFKDPKFQDKNGSDVINPDKGSKKNYSDIIKNIALEKKREGEFADARREPKKYEVTNLNRQYQYFLVDPKDYENSIYEINARNFSYYPIGSYAVIDATQKSSIDDAIRTISNDSNWNQGFGKSMVSSLKIATDVVSMINLVGPSTNIYEEGATANRLRWDLRLYENNELASLETPDKEDKRLYTYEDESKVEFTGPELTEEDKEEGSIEIEDLKLIEELKKEEEGSVEIRDLKLIEEPKEEQELKDDLKDEKTLRKEIELEKFANDSSKKIENLKFAYKDKSRNIQIDSQNIASTSTGLREDRRWYDNPSSIGQIYVMPPENELAENSNDSKKNQAFSIPLQNNLTFEQISRAATWNAINFFGRIGDVQQYSKTGNLEAISVTTKYFVDDDPRDNKIDNSLRFTIQDLQDIEMKYRSLVLPASDSAKYLYGGDNDEGNNYYYFTRPPIINIVLGNPKFETSSRANLEESEEIKNRTNPYHNLFTDIYTIPNINNSNNFDNSIFYKNFVVTNVSIDKNLNEYNYYIGQENNDSIHHFYDTTGFTVTLTLLEIDENYLGSLPSFNNYEYTLKSRGIIKNVQ